MAVRTLSKGEAARDEIIAAVPDARLTVKRLDLAESRYGLVGPTKRVALPRSSRGIDLAASLWAVAAGLTGVALPVHEHATLAAARAA